ncbi:MAG: BBP7 family outer membrane beta-barrel protein [Pirellulaceae bacterium]|nr:BBP7 family outer membrane beta-barrel protein [Pirellulaceae bacterium]
MRFTTILLAAAMAWSLGPALALAQEYAPAPMMPSGPAAADPIDPYAAQQFAMQQEFARQQQFALAQQQALLAGYGEPMPSGTNPWPAEDTACDDGSCGCCSHCCRRLDIWGSAEALLWWAKGTHAPPLVTTSPQGTPQSAAGVLPGADILFGSTHLGDDVQLGGRLTLGVWLDEEHNVAVASRFYGTGGDTKQFRASSDGNPILARPFYNVLLDQPDALLIAFDDPMGTDIVDGDINIKFRNQNFLAAESYLQLMMHRDQRTRVDAVAGYQFTRLDDGLIVDTTQILRQLGNTQIDLQDRFIAHNEFHGGMIGLRGQMARGAWAFDVLGKVGIGISRQTVNIDGSVFVNGVQQPSGGLLALPTNIGEYDRGKFIFIPEFTANLKYYATPNLSFHVGYSILMWSNVVLSADQIDLGVNPSQFITGNLVGPARPTFDFQDTTYWMQGINFGMNFDF